MENHDSLEEVTDENPIRVIRMNSDPNMFYRVTEEEMEVLEPNCTPYQILEVLRKIIKEYIQTICLWMCLIPERILSIYSYCIYIDNSSVIIADLSVLTIFTNLLSVVFLIVFFLLALVKK